MNMNPEINGKTKLCGLMGDPVEHSVSPAMHNAAFRALGLDYVYLPFRVRREDLAAAIAGVIDNSFLEFFLRFGAATPPVMTPVSLKFSNEDFVA